MCLATCDAFWNLSSPIMRDFSSDLRNLSQLCFSTFLISKCGMGKFSQRFEEERFGIILISFKDPWCRKRSDRKEVSSLFWRRKSWTRFIFMLGYYLFRDNIKEKFSQWLKSLLLKCITWVESGCVATSQGFFS